MNKRESALCLVTVALFASPFGCAHTRTNATTKPLENKSDSQNDGPIFADIPDAADAPADAIAIPLQSKVTEVTVYSDRARVTRRAEANVTTESQVFSFRRLPGWVDDGSVRVAADAGRIVDVRVERNFLARSSDAAYRKAEANLKALENQAASINDEIAVLDAQKVQIESIKAFSLEKITKDTTIGNISVKSYSDVVTFISDSLRKTAKDRRDAQNRLDELTPTVDAARRRLDDMKALLKLEETTVLVTLQSAEPVKSTLELTYMLPGATWEPTHEIRVSTSDSNSVEVISFAQVSQTSGEDWGDAKLWFSTQSTTEAVRIPELEALTLGDMPKTARITTSKISTFSRAQSAYAGQNRLWNKVHQSARINNFDQVYESNMEYLQVAQSKIVQLFESLKNRGTTERFQAAAVHNVSGDGKPTRLRIGYSTLKSNQKIVAVPEQSLNAALTLNMTNTSGQSLLPGKVSLYQDGAFIGMTEIDFIAENESFAMFLSVADQIKLSRTLDRKQSSLVHKKVNKMLVTFVVTAENLLAEKTALTLADRIPVSEDKEIKVGNVKISPQTSPDSQGILHWDLELKPKEKRVFTISYQVEYPSELILEARRRRMQEQVSDNFPKGGLSAPGLPEDISQNMAPEIYQQSMQKAVMPSPAPRSKATIEDQLMDLESKF